MQPGFEYFSEKLRIYFAEDGPLASRRGAFNLDTMPRAPTTVCCVKTYETRCIQANRDIYIQMQVKASPVLHLPVALKDTDWHSAVRMDVVRARGEFGIKKHQRYDSLSIANDDDEKWICQVNISAYSSFRLQSPETRRIYMFRYVFCSGHAQLTCATPRTDRWLLCAGTPRNWPGSVTRPTCSG